MKADFNSLQQFGVCNLERGELTHRGEVSGCRENKYAERSSNMTRISNSSSAKSSVKPLKSQPVFGLFSIDPLATGEAAGPITVVAISGSASDRARLQALARAEGYPVIIRGLEHGPRVEREICVKSIRHALDAEIDWPRLVTLFAEQADFVVSNTTEAGLTMPRSGRVRGRGTHHIELPFRAVPSASNPASDYGAPVISGTS